MKCAPETRNGNATVTRNVCIPATPTVSH
jgi:hypothetical protein